MQSLSADASQLLCSDDRPIGRKRTSERDTQGACSLNVEAVDRLDMEVRFGAVAGVPAMTENLADLNVLSRPNPCTSMLEMAERNDAPVAPDHHVIAGERQPPRASTPVLRQRIADRGQAP